MSQDIKNKVMQILDGHPHRGAILDSDMRFWIDEVVGKYGDLAIWHAKRAGGFGGSQIGALVKNFQNLRADHEQTANEIVATCLLRKTPDEPTGPMRRGIEMEAYHRQRFYKKHHAVRDQQGFDALSAGQGTRAWMRYSPDDLVLMAAPVSTEVSPDVLHRVLLDYKAPTTVDDAQGISFQYACQLHMGRMVCTANNVHVDGLMLSQFDWSIWDMKDDSIAHIPELDTLIEAAGDHYWQFVLRGELPAFVRKERLSDEVSDAIKAEVGTELEKLAKLSAVGTWVDAQIKELKAVVSPKLQEVRFAGARFAHGGMSYTAPPQFDEAKIAELLPVEVLESIPLGKSDAKRYDDDSMAKRLRELGEDMKLYLKPANLDAEALHAALVQNGLNADGLMTEKLRGTVSKDLKAQTQTWIEHTFSDLLKTPKAEVSAANEEVTTDDREGRLMTRYAPRSVGA
jgi:hypothetical protein